MTNVGMSGSNPAMGAHDGPSKPSKPAEVADVATSAASEVVSTAATGAKDAAGEVAVQARVVAGEAMRQVGTVVDSTRQELSAQADQRAQQAAGGLRTLADQVTALAEGRPGEAGPLVGYLGDARSRVSAVADRLESGGPQGLLDDVTGFARRRPVVFLAAAIGAGFVVGRLARAGKAAQDATGETSSASSVVASMPPPSAGLLPPAVIADAPGLPREPGLAGAGVGTATPSMTGPGQR